MILVAPYLDPQRKETKDFFEFSFDPDLPSRLNQFHVLTSDDDEEWIIESTNIIAKTYPKATYHKFKDKGHFVFSSMKTDKFPELLEIINL